MPDKAKIAAFFGARKLALPVFESAARRILKYFPHAQMQIEKTQITFCDPAAFAYIWLPPVARQKPDDCVVLSFVLPYALDNSRISNVTFVRHDRHTHHLPLTLAHGVDSGALSWLGEAHDLMRLGNHNQHRAK